jgi:hypothetical protein
VVLSLLAGPRSVYLLYQYKSTNTDAESRARHATDAHAQAVHRESTKRLLSSPGIVTGTQIKLSCPQNNLRKKKLAQLTLLSLTSTNIFFFVLTASGGVDSAALLGGLLFVYTEEKEQLRATLQVRCSRALSLPVYVYTHTLSLSFFLSQYIYI